ncbi:MAG TPA: hypothetical protein DDY38_00210 [Firmicutes bacterium]|nr:hypothetical protein [Bacillota bacterium]
MSVLCDLPKHLNYKRQALPRLDKVIQPFTSFSIAPLEIYNLPPLFEIIPTYYTKFASRTKKDCLVTDHN